MIQITEGVGFKYNLSQWRFDGNINRESLTANQLVRQFPTLTAGKQHVAIVVGRQLVMTTMALKTLKVPVIKFDVDWMRWRCLLVSCTKPGLINLDTDIIEPIAFIDLIKDKNGVLHD
jgi:hypothetical protein